MAVTFFNVSI